MSACPKCGLNLLDFSVGPITEMPHRQSKFSGPDPKTLCAGPDSYPCVVRQLAHAREREATEKARADSAEGILRAANFCEAHEPDPGEPEKHCPACLAVHENDLRVKAEAERDEAREVLTDTGAEAEILRQRAMDIEAEAKRLYRLMQETDSHKRLEQFVKRADNRVERLRAAFNAAVRRPMGVVPDGYEDLYDAKEADDA